MNKRAMIVSSVFLILTSCVTLWDENNSRYATFSKSEPVQGEKTLEAYVKLNVGTMQIEPGTTSNAYELDVEYNERAFRPRLDFDRSGERATLRFELKGEGKSVRRVGKSRLNLRLNPDISLRLEAETGVGESQIDLSGMKVESLLLESGVGETRLSMLSPNKVNCEEVELRCGVGALEVTGLGNFSFKDFRFKGGVGGSKLDFSGDWREVGDVDISVGVGGVEILLPRDIGAEIRMSRSFLTGVDIDGFRKEGDKYVSENIDRAKKIVRFRISAGVGGIEIRWI